MIKNIDNFLSKNSHVPTIGIGQDVKSAMEGSATPFVPPAPGSKAMVHTASVAFDTKLTNLTDRFFKYYKKNRIQLDKCIAYIGTLNSDFEKWLNQNGTIYDFDKCKNAFIERMDDCLDSSIIHAQMTKMKEEKNISQ